MIKAFRQFIRLLEINLIIAKYGLDRVILPKNHKGYYFTYLNPWHFRRDEKKQPQEIREALERLGPIFVKFGQVLSTRRDLIPSNIADELSKLQDQVLPFSFEIVKKTLEETYGAPVEKVFAQFDSVPIASASIAQVHAGTLHSGEAVVIKVLRPNIQKIIRHDIGLMYVIAKIIQKFLPKNSGLYLPDLVSEFEQTLIDELDLVREGANASLLRRNFLYSDLLYIPKVYWEYSHKNVLVTERIYGIPIDDIAALKATHIPLKTLAIQGIKLFFTQVFRDSFFHADMHPGNIFVSSSQEERPQYIFVDFGIVGTLDDKDQYYIAENLMAFLNRDYRRVAMLHVESGWLPSDTDIRQFESSIRTACEPIFEKPLKDISLAQVLIRLFQTARHFNIEIQPQLMLLQKTLLNLEGLTRQLYPDLDFWDTSRPFLEYWMRKKHHPIYLLKRIKKRLPYWMESFIESTNAKQIQEILSPKVFSTPLHSNKIIKKPNNKKPYLAAGLSFIASSLYFYLFGETMLDKLEFAPLAMLISGFLFALYAIF